MSRKLQRYKDGGHLSFPFDRGHTRLSNCDSSKLLLPTEPGAKQKLRQQSPSQQSWQGFRVGLGYKALETALCVGPTIFHRSPPFIITFPLTATIFSALLIQSQMTLTPPLVLTGGRSGHVPSPHNQKQSCLVVNVAVVKQAHNVVGRIVSIQLLLPSYLGLLCQRPLEHRRQMLGKDPATKRPQVTFENTMCPLQRHEEEEPETGL